MPPSKASDKLSEAPVANSWTGTSGAPSGKATATKAQAKKFPCDQECHVCSSQYRSPELQITDRGRYEREYSDEKAREVIEEHVDGITKSLSAVRQGLLEHGDVFAQRWNKKSTSGRATIIQQIAPDMLFADCLEAGFAFEEEYGAKTAKHGRHMQSTARRMFWLLSYLTVDTLSKDPTKILSLLHVRTSELLEHLLAFDLERATAAFDGCLVKTNYNAMCVSMFDSEAGHIGDMIRFDASQVHRGDTVGFPRAELAFEAAHTLSKFLDKIVSKVLTNECGPSQGRLKLDALLAKSAQASLGARQRYYERPFAKLYKGDLVRLHDLLACGMKAARDEVWLMQTVPMYLREKFAQIEAQLHYRRLSPASHAECILQSLFDTIDHVHLAACMDEDFAECMPALEAGSLDVKRGQPLTNEYDQALGHLYSAIEGYYSVYRNALPKLLALSPAFRSYFRWNVEPCSRRMVPQLSTSLKTIWQKDRLCWHLLQLCTSEPQNGLDRGLHLHFVDNLLQTCGQDGRVSQTLYDHISYMMVFDDAARELASHLPRGSGAGRQKDAEDRKPSLEAERLASEILAQAPDLVSAFMRTPVPRKSQTRETLERMHNLHQAVKDFWSVFLHTWADLPESSARLEGNMRSELTAYLTEECEDGFNDECADLEMAIRNKEEALQARKATSSQIPTVSSDVQTVWGEQITQPTTTSAHRKGKATSKSVPTESCNDEVKPLPTRPKPRPAQERIAVSAESRCLLAAMYTRRRQQGSGWQQLVSALSDAGLAMVHTGGSAVMFSHATERLDNVPSTTSKVGREFISFKMLWKEVEEVVWLGCRHVRGARVCRLSRTESAAGTDRRWAGELLKQCSVWILATA
ncbi:hypothetical protein LTR22_022017 [Elasticomyces elasticus]|nr:hypothetical protein LTR22_022017 [Elasticomyces elasticus]KAK5756365.1 hypothetical protein LTS12_013554 [Elasticomyces elasticus]